MRSDRVTSRLDPAPDPEDHVHIRSVRNIWERERERERDRGRKENGARLGSVEVSGSGVDQIATWYI